MGQRQPQRSRQKLPDRSWECEESKAGPLAAVVNQYDYTEAVYPHQVQSSRHQEHMLQMSAVDCPAEAQTTCTRNMPLDHMPGAHGSTVGDLAVDVDREAAAVASIEPVGPAGSEEAASIVHVVVMCYLEA
jgi:hypothetical protein